jgi:hypothetical protein
MKYSWPYWIFSCHMLERSNHIHLAISHWQWHCGYTVTPWHASGYAATVLPDSDITKVQLALVSGVLSNHRTYHGRKQRHDHILPFVDMFWELTQLMLFVTKKDVEKHGDERIEFFEWRDSWMKDGISGGSSTPRYRFQFLLSSWN